MTSAVSTPAPLQPFCPIPERVTAIARLHPTRVAVDAGTRGTLTYVALENEAARIATRLVALGAGPGSLVGACLERSIHLIPALLGILKTGAAYLPLDHTYPPERLDFMLRDSGASIVVTSGAILGAVPAHVTLMMLSDTLPDPALSATPSLTPLSLAYVIYTSGSTGQPKGVEITHGGVANLLDSFTETPGTSADDRVVAITTLSFDIAVIEIWLPLVLGATIVLATRRTAMDGEALRA